MSTSIPGFETVKNNVIKPLIVATEKVVEYYMATDNRPNTLALAEQEGTQNQMDVSNNGIKEYAPDRFDQQQNTASVGQDTNLPEKTTQPMSTHGQSHLTTSRGTSSMQSSLHNSDMNGQSQQQLAHGGFQAQGAPSMVKTLQI